MGRDDALPPRSWSQSPCRRRRPHQGARGKVDSSGDVNGEVKQGKWSWARKQVPVKKLGCGRQEGEGVAVRGGQTSLHTPTPALGYLS